MTTHPTTHFTTHLPPLEHLPPHCAPFHCISRLPIFNDLL